jgi:hypothetical protein
MTQIDADASYWAFLTLCNKIKKFVHPMIVYTQERVDWRNFGEGINILAATI